MLSSDIQNILAVVDSLYVQADPDAISFRQFNKSVASYFGLKKFQGTQRLYIRTRLSHLINGKAQIGDYTELGLGSTEVAATRTHLVDHFRLYDEITFEISVMLKKNLNVRLGCR